jgi:hypothetical protein
MHPQFPQRVSLMMFEAAWRETDYLVMVLR